MSLHESDRKRLEEKINRLETTAEQCRTENDDLRRRIDALAQELSEKNQALEAARADSSSKSIFLANMSHDLRTPLAGMLNMIGMIQEDPQAFFTLENMRLIRESGEQLKMLIQNIIDLSKIEAGTLALKEKPFPVRGALIQVARSFEHPARAKNLFLRVDVDNSVPEQVKMDKERFVQVVTHLVSNAVRFTDSGAVTVKAACCRPQTHAAKAGPHLSIEVEDTGIGIAEDLQQKIFDSFRRTDLVKISAGTGLGLAIARGLTQLMGGSMQLRSVVGKGSVFGVELPFQPVQAQAKAVQAQTHTPLSDLGPLRVLVVEDNFINLLSFQQMLEQQGFSVQSATNGEQALECIGREAFDVVLMDIKMPVMDGLEATRRIRSSDDARVRGTKIIALTAYGMPEDRKRVFNAGLDEMITKPIEKEELAKAFARVLPDKSASHS